MMRGVTTVGLAILGLAAAGCSNAPLAGTLDCLFPSKARVRPDAGPRLPDDLSRPRGGDGPLPPPNLRDLDGSRPADGRLEGLPKIGDPLDPDATPRGRRDAAPASDRMPLPAPMFDDPPAGRLRER